MEACEYKGINNCPDDGGTEKVQIFSKYFVRQMILCSGVWATFFQAGMTFGAPTVTIPQIRRLANSTATVSEEMVSWLSAAYLIGGIPWAIILPILAGYIGRKKTHLTVSFVVLIADTFLYFSTTVSQLLTCQMVLGILCAATLTLAVILIEFTSPQYRGMFMTVNIASLAWGIWVTNAIGTYVYWKYIYIVSLVSCLYVIFVAILLMPESPYWLAAKGRFEECTTSHRWLKGCDEQNERELDNLIGKQRAKGSIKNACNKMSTKNNTISRLLSKRFYKPTLVGILLVIQCNSTGKIVCTIYVIDIIQKITDSESTAYTMLILDGITVIGMYCGCILSKFLKRRTLFFTTSTLGTTLLYLLSLYLYLIKLSIIVENYYASLALLTVYYLIISCGPMILSTNICCELIPVKNRTLSMIFVCEIGVFLMVLFVKFAPFLFKVCDLHGGFLFYAVITTICTLLLYKYLPETKDKTLQEIEDFICGKNKTVEEEKKLHEFKLTENDNNKTI